MKEIPFPDDEAIRVTSTEGLCVPYVLERVVELGNDSSSDNRYVSLEELAVKFAYYAGRPLLLTGEPGVGKSQLAHLVAALCGSPLRTKVVDSRTEPHDLLYEYDAVARLAAAQAMGNVGEAERKEILDPEQYLRPGVLWHAFAPEHAARQAMKCARGRHALAAADTVASEPPRIPVVLIDEIDKASSDVPNALLDALGDGRFNLPFDLGAVRADPENPPLVFITTNNERALPKPFIRRCLVHEIAFPKNRDRLVARARVHFGIGSEKAQSSKLDEDLFFIAADLLLRARNDLDDRGYRPGVAEYLDLLRSVTRWPHAEEKKKEMLEKLAPLAFSKATKSIFGNAS